MTKKDNKKYNVSIISNILTYYSYKNIKNNNREKLLFPL